MTKQITSYFIILILIASASVAQNSAAAGAGDANRGYAPLGPTPVPTMVFLPADAFDVSDSTTHIEAVIATDIDPSLGYVAFQGDMTFDSAVVSFDTPAAEVAGLTAANWTISSKILNTGPGTIQTLHISAALNDGSPLNGSGTLYNLRMLRVSKTVGAATQLVWQPAPDNFVFIDTTQNAIAPIQNNGIIAITGPTPAPPDLFERVSTRAFVGTGDTLLISSFIVLGDKATKQVLIRALGPSLVDVSTQLADPTLELRDSNGSVIASNNNWRDSQEAEIIATGQAPSNDLESAILVTSLPGVYTAIVAGSNSTTGVARVEMIDVDSSTDSALLYISSRAAAQSGDHAIVGGFTINGPQSQTVVIRGIGPSLGVSGIPNALPNPAIELRDSSGSTLVFNDNWRDTQEAEIIAAGIPPTDDLESAILATLPPGSYTAELTGACSGAGIASVEIYNLNLPGGATSIPPSSQQPLCGPTPTPGPPTITSPLTAVATVGQLFVYQFGANGASSLAVSNLPGDLTFDTNLSAIIGTPAAAGTLELGLSATNAAGTTNATLTLTVQPTPEAGPTIISSTAATGRPGLPFTFQVITTGGSTAARVSASGLPPGLAIDPVTGIISGTTPLAGSFAVTLTVTDGNFTASALLQLTMTADPAVPVILGGLNPGGGRLPGSVSLTPGQFFSFTILAPSTADPVLDPTVFTLVGALPSGLSFDASTGTISGVWVGIGRTSAVRDPNVIELAGGILVGNIQLFATNSHGSSTFDLLFRLAPSGAVNISTRIEVGTNNDVLIGGFIVTGNAPKIVVVRAIGPSTNIPGALQDPTLELHDGVGNVVINDNWRDTQAGLVEETGIAPSDDRESAIVIALDPGAYTAIVAGKNGTTGIALVEVYDLGTGSMDVSTGDAKLVNISTRGNVNTGNSVMIGGFIISQSATRLVVRGLGPSLASAGIAHPLPDTTLELRDGTGSLVFSNDDWRSTQEEEIIATNLAPPNDLESAIVITLMPGSYTAIVRGKDDSTGVGLVEAYSLGQDFRAPSKGHFLNPPGKRSLPSSSNSAISFTRLTGRAP